MERDARIFYIGDTYTSKIGEALQDKLLQRYTRQKGYDISFFSYVSKSGLDEAVEVAATAKRQEANVVVVYLGCHEAAKSEPADVFETKYLRLLKALDSLENVRIVGCTLPEYPAYSKLIEQILTRQQKRIANIFTYWKHEKKSPNMIQAEKADGMVIQLSLQAIIPVLIRTKMLVLWQYNGRYAHCNYACPYCYVATSVNKGMHIVYDLDKWEKAFSRHFENVDTVFYFSYGEPMTGGKHFYEALEMIGRHPMWSARMTSNVSLPLEKLLQTRLAREHRLNVNASFHPTQTSIEAFVSKCDQLRAAGIEPSVIYVMYPNQIDDLEEKYMPVFRGKGYRVHIRAFRGLYKGKKYPQAYTKEQWKKTAKYMDRGNFKYQLPAVNGLGRMSMLGMTHILVDNYGKIEMCDSYVGDRHYGNIFDETIYLDLQPYPFPGLVPLAAVDDIADYVEVNYDDLEENNVNDYNTQGDVYVREDGSIYYPYENVDLTDRKAVKQLLEVPKPFVPAWKYWVNPRWIGRHFIYSYVIKKYGKYVFAWVRGKWSLLKKGQLKKENFWHG